MENSFKFFRNHQCRYFPCHEVENDFEFNCMFCFCPLYHLKDCGGKPEIKNGIKSCSNCTLPHRPEGYDYIISKLKEKREQSKETA
ncbi:Cysteine-rich small domain-containing protein [Maridesulfovibrio ferrireducens]|uniref:Cysteine-rich small domain-containing protein n=1 Tax=Maridesulfovibrio ferrireducens TaxID=246191 RepID=A0A1G9BFY6_9BACT|nr:cysteine-rich small domain-containing protein [Maridesulfovibrio ferrireducens]SDK38438.1 Cysteine-rich small domain-containing protein [Maridesulfovibrio ferrireducens]